MVSSFEKHAFHMYHAPQRTDFFASVQSQCRRFFLCLKFFGIRILMEPNFFECHIHRNHPIPIIIHFRDLIDFNDSFVSGTRIIWKLRTPCELLRIFLTLFQRFKKSSSLLHIRLCESLE